MCIGLDGGDLPYIRSRRENLPNFDRLLREGRVVTPDGYKELNGCSWHCFNTGLPPGDHGLYQHLNWDPGRMGIRLIDPSWYRLPAFWRALEAEGARVTVVDVPYSMPGNLQSGTEVIDFATHGKTLRPWSNKPAVDEMMRRMGTCPMGRESPIPKTEAHLERTRQEMIKSVERKRQFLCDLARQDDWDLFVGVFAESHRGGHTLFARDDAIGANAPETRLLTIYQEIDGAIGDLARIASGTGAAFAVFSVHGMEKDKNQPGVIDEVITRINARFSGRDTSGRVTGGRGFSLVRSLRQTVPAGVQLRIANAVPDRVREWVVGREIAGGLDWSSTPGFALRTDVCSDLRLNIRGRERDGILEFGSDAHDAYVVLLYEVFNGLEDAHSGERLVKELVPTGELFVGHASTAIPDFIVSWNDLPLARRVRGPLIGEFDLGARQMVRGGDHTVDGFAIVTGEPLPASLPRIDKINQFGAFFGSLVSEP